MRTISSCSNTRGPRTSNPRACRSVTAMPTSWPTASSPAATWWWRRARRRQRRHQLLGRRRAAAAVPRPLPGRWRPRAPVQPVQAVGPCPRAPSAGAAGGPLRTVRRGVQQAAFGVLRPAAAPVPRVRHLGPPAAGLPLHPGAARVAGRQPGAVGAGAPRGPAAASPGGPAEAGAAVPGALRRLARRVRRHRAARGAGPGPRPGQQRPLRADGRAVPEDRAPNTPLAGSSGCARTSSRPSSIPASTIPSSRSSPTCWLRASISTPRAGGDLGRPGCRTRTTRMKMERLRALVPAPAARRTSTPAWR